ncbi:MAG TPA: hypothetical protein VES20_11835 [Bryobacteraceae bacterium]|nr:hypothetical protein [Bryobacteraceae bacterium]
MTSVSAVALLLAAAWDEPKVLATVRITGLTESSGLVASRRHPGVFWTHNDSGARPELFAIDAGGKLRGRCSVPGVKARDWESLAAGPGPVKGQSYLYIGDIGNNMGHEKGITVYRLREPELKADRCSAAEALTFRWPSRRHDAEALLIHPTSGDLYVVTKERGDDRMTFVYKAAAPLKSGSALKRVAILDLPDTRLFTAVVGGVTGGDISPDGRRVVLCDYLKAYEAELPPGSKRFDAIWRTKWQVVGTGLRPQGEAVAYRADGNAVVLTSEGESFNLIEVPRNAAKESRASTK